MLFRLFYEIGYISTLDSKFDNKHILDNGQPFDLLFINAQEAALFIANCTKRLNENMHHGYYYINVLNWIREEV